MSDADVGKRIPNAVDTGTYAIGTYTLTDVAIGALPGVFVILVFQLVVPPATTVAGYRLSTITLPLAGLAMAGGALVVCLTPTHLTTIQWLAMVAGFQTRPTRIPHDAALEQTQVAALHPDEHVIERVDGAFVGVLHVSAPPMALATDEEWAHKAASFREFVNTVLDFPIQVYSTTQPFPVDAYLDPFESRQTDSDVKSNPRLERLREEYISWYRRTHANREIPIREQYVIVAVTPQEVCFEREGLWQSLASLPVVGVVVELRSPKRDAIRAAMFDAIADRLKRVERGLTSIDGCDARRLDASEATELIATFWEGEAVRYGDPAQVLSPRCLHRRPH